MLCHAGDDDAVRWLYVQSGTAQQLKVYADGLILDGYKEKLIAASDRTTAGDSSVVLLNPQKNDTGWYVCVTESGGRISKKIVVAVYVSGQ
jgi:hypothetical protein